MKQGRTASCNIVADDYVRKLMSLSLACWTMLITSGCATIISGTHQNISVKIQPPGSRLMLYRWNGEVVAGPIYSPKTEKIHRPKWNQPYLAVAFKDSHCPRYWVPENSPSTGAKVLAWWTILTLSLGGIISSVIDLSNGSMVSLNEAEFNSMTLQEEPCEERQC